MKSTNAMSHSIFFILLIVSMCVACGSNDTPSITKEAVRVESNALKVAAVVKQDNPKTVTKLNRETHSSKKKNPLGVESDQKQKQKQLEEKIIKRLSKGKVTGVRPISQRSLSLKITFSDNKKAVFKPLRKINSTARFEVAFYLMAKMFQIDVVPISTMRVVSKCKITGHLNVNYPKTSARFDLETREYRAGAVAGAMIEWIKDTKPSPYDQLGGRKEMTRLLAVDGPLVSEDPMVAELSAAIVLDYISGNWDRFSGGNLFLNKSGDKLVLIDNNGAFSSWHKHRQQKMDALLSLVQRFPKKLIAKLRIISREEIIEGLRPGTWTGSKLILNDKEIAQILKRRDDLIAHINALLKIYGKDKILVFP